MDGDIVLSKDVIEKLSPGIRHLVVWLNAMGFRTTDSGDGSNAKEGMGCAVDYPMVAVEVEPKSLVHEADRLRQLLLERGVDFTKGQLDRSTGADAICWPMIQGSYDPADGTAFLVLMNVADEDVDLS